MASMEQARDLGCAVGALLVVMTEADFKRVWKLAREAIHFNAATRTGE